MKYHLTSDNIYATLQIYNAQSFYKKYITFSKYKYCRFTFSVGDTTWAAIIARRGLVLAMDTWQATPPWASGMPSKVGLLTSPGPTALGRGRRRVVPESGHTSYARKQQPLEVGVKVYIYLAMDIQICSPRIGVPPSGFGIFFDVKQTVLLGPKVKGNPSYISWCFRKMEGECNKGGDFLLSHSNVKTLPNFVSPWLTIVVCLIIKHCPIT